ncbi:hypothetical protein MMC22_000739 [Lobaria immixta]|nr:hypothetical protein [Lobaria immixta]
MTILKEAAVCNAQNHERNISVALEHPPAAGQSPGGAMISLPMRTPTWVMLTHWPDAHSSCHVTSVSMPHRTPLVHVMPKAPGVGVDGGIVWDRLLACKLACNKSELGNGRNKGKPESGYHANPFAKYANPSEPSPSPST